MSSREIEVSKALVDAREAETGKRRQGEAETGRSGDGEAETGKQGSRDRGGLGRTVQAKQICRSGRGQGYLQLG